MQRELRGEREERQELDKGDGEAHRGAGFLPKKYLGFVCRGGERQRELEN